MVYIYVDMLILLNIYVNYFLLLLTAKLTFRKISIPRCLISSFIGSLTSLIIFVKIPIILLMPLKIVFAYLITGCGFGFRKSTIKQTLYFITSNVLLSGAIYAFGSSNMLVKNLVFYMDFSLLYLVIFTLLSYIIVSVIQKIFFKSKDIGGEYQVIICENLKVFKLCGLADSGNLLTDIGKPVIVCDKNKIVTPKNLREISFGTISGDDLISVFTPDEVIIKNICNGKKKRVDAVIGLAPSMSNREAIFNPKILN